jgi:low temperature requirement protein LtrA
VMFGVAYLVVRVLHLALFSLAGRGDPHLHRAVLRIVPTVVTGGGLLVLAGFLHGSVQIACWAVAAVIDYGGPLVGHMRGWTVSTRHFTERYGQFILIALGESVVAMGVGAQGLVLDAGVITAALLGVCVVACLWWAYFDWVVYVAHTRLAEATGTRRAALARDAYSYIHLPMVAGIVLFAFGLLTTLHATSHDLAVVPAFALVGGVAVYFIAHVLFRLRIGGGLGRGRPVTAVVLLALFPVATAVPSLAALGIVAAVCVALIAYEVLSHREERRAIRGQRDGTVV